MRFVGYDELNPGHNFPKLADSFEKEAYPGKNKVIHFLKNGTVDLARMSRVKDIVTGKVIPTEVLVMHDGDFYWSNILAWYVEKYNLRLPQDFENHILNNA